MMTEDRPYAGILMNDGTEISHYGVKGMKWGKKLFGKVKGVFGKPEGPHTKTLYKSKTGKIGANGVPRAMANKKMINQNRQHTRLGSDLFRNHDVYDGTGKKVGSWRFRTYKNEEESSSKKSKRSR